MSAVVASGLLLESAAITMMYGGLLPELAIYLSTINIALGRETNPYF